MKNKLSVASRILVAFASGALVAVFFLPAWRIDLFAPQYPEGLTMNIWINGLSGDVDVINGLNHYIGMKHISVEMFPEFNFLPYVVAFYMLFGMIVSITGSRRLLLMYLGLTVIGGTLAMYDFYQWGYDYGHNLDPNAAIQVPGLSYQPPLFGHKRLLNFDAYSFPDVGGWIVIGASLLAFGVWIAEWWMRRRQKTRPAALAIPALLGMLLISSCQAQPEPFRYGVDNCHFCKMGITDPKYGCEVVTKKGKVYKFDDLVCLVRFQESGAVPENEIAHKVVIHFEKENSFLPVAGAAFWYSPNLRSPMGSHIAAFPGREAAEKSRPGGEGKLLTWPEVINRLK